MARQTVVKGERHVPGLRREDREDRRAFESELRTREEGDEPGDRHREKPEDRHRLENVEDGQHHLLRAPQSRRGRGVDEGKQQRQTECREHPQ